MLVEKGLASQTDVSNALARQKRQADSVIAAQTMRVDVRKLDELINLVGELVLERNRLYQLSRELSMGRLEMQDLTEAFSQSTARLSFITEELQAAGLRARMVPIDTVFRKFPRLVRDVAHNLKKEVDLLVSGEDTELDKTMVEMIGDPLVHLVRNSLDHGLELPDVRESARKPRNGTIELESKLGGGTTVFLRPASHTSHSPRFAGGSRKRDLCSPVALRGRNRAHSCHRAPPFRRKRAAPSAG